MNNQFVFNSTNTTVPFQDYMKHCDIIISSEIMLDIYVHALLFKNRIKRS